jgi:hypothetical protein
MRILYFKKNADINNRLLIFKFPLTTHLRGNGRSRSRKANVVERIQHKARNQANKPCWLDEGQSIGSHQRTNTPKSPFPSGSSS